MVSKGLVCLKGTELSCLTNTFLASSLSARCIQCIMSVTEKQCTLCKNVKPVSAFISAFADGLTNRCSDCRARGQRAHSKYVNKNKRAILDYQADYVRERLARPVGDGEQACKRCLHVKLVTGFAIGPKGTRHKTCDDCRRKYYAGHSAKWRATHPEQAKAQNERAKQRQQERRLQCFDHYGKRCACCGESHYEFLTLDHVEGNGCKHRAEIHPGQIYTWLIKRLFPSGFRTLCWNCNWGCRLNNGICPHEKERAA